MHNELLGSVEDHSVALEMMFADSAEVSVEYGTASGSYSSQLSWQLFADSTVAAFVLNGLTPNTQYYYRVSHRVPGSVNIQQRPEYTFHTARPSGNQFSFVIQADPHLDNQTDTAIYNRCLQNQLEDHPDFMIDLGDNVMTDKLTNAARVVTRDTIIYRTRLLRSYYEKTCHSVPLFLTLGNHEGELGWLNNGTANCVPVWNTLERNKYYVNPLPDNFFSSDTTNYPFVGQRASYYSWTWGDAQFIILDPYWHTTPKPDSLHGWYWTLGRRQFDWLRNTLQNSTARFKFVFSHQLVGGDPDGRGGIEFADRYEWGGSNLDGSPGFTANRPGWYKPIKDILTENRVNIFFHGHDHFFAKQDKDCLVYQECPQPGHPNFSNAGQAAGYGYFQGQILPNSGHLRVTVDSTGVRVDYVRAYKAADETATRHNKDISATYFIGARNCYDSLSTDVPVVWNVNYPEDKVFPNPFSHFTTIEFTLPQELRVDLEIFDMQGRSVRRLLHSAPIPAGTFQVDWDGTSGEGAMLAPGSYTYSITSGNSFRSVGKLLLTN